MLALDSISILQNKDIIHIITAFLSRKMRLASVKTFLITTCLSIGIPVLINPLFHIFHFIHSWRVS